METDNLTTAIREPWNKGKLVGQKTPFKTDPSKMGRTSIFYTQLALLSRYAKTGVVTATEIVMSISRSTLLVLFTFGMLPLGGCAGLQSREPIQVIMAAVEPIQGEGLELRMMVKLRIQNPNDFPLDFTGVSVQLDVQGKSFATGVSDVAGSVPRYGETIVNVPVSISVFRIARQAIGVMTNEYGGKLAYDMSGKLAGPALNSVRFRSKGEFTLPADFSEGGK